MIVRTALLLAVLLVSRGSAPTRTERVDHWENGAVKSRTPLVDGRADGVAHAWFPDGRRMWARAFRNGREEGKHQGWWPNGAPKFAYAYSNGVLEGATHDWYADGTQFRIATYRHGQEEGRQRMWDADGSLRASSEVRSGRRYGSIGDAWWTSSLYLVRPNSMPKKPRFAK